MPATFIWFLFDWRGRIGRSAYRISLLMFALFVAAVHFSPIRADAFLLGMTAIQLVVQAALDAKRLHDIGHSAAWVVWSSAACVAVAFAAVLQQPDTLVLLRESLADTIGDSAALSPIVCIVSAGLGLAGGLRSSWLWAPDSRPAGGAYDYDPRHAHASESSEEGRGSFDPDALIARALAERAAALKQVAKENGGGAGAGRKPFGRRTA